MVTLHVCPVNQSPNKPVVALPCLVIGQKLGRYISSMIVFDSVFKILF